MTFYNTISKIIDIFSQLLMVDIAFFSSEGELLVATAAYKEKKGIKVHLPYFQKYKAESFIDVKKPGHMSMCKGCHFQNNCPSKVEILKNLIQDENHYGYLNFVSFTSDGETQLLSQQSTYQYWLTKLGDVLIDLQKSFGHYKPLKKQTLKAIPYILGDNFSNIHTTLKNIRNSASSVFITGETGTGKSLLARYIHEHSLVQKGKFIEINCASIPESLFESELFGYEEGSFTGARKNGKLGYFELADKGTLFLDEITELPIHLQAKLLMTLQDGIIRRVGSTSFKKVNIRIIAATNRPLEELVKKGDFRTDLYYRLNVIPISLPPLRNRKEDLHDLVNTLMDKLQNRTGKFIRSYSSTYFELLQSYHWPGNIRELENVIEYSMIMENSMELSITSLPPYILESAQHKPQQNPANSLKQAEKELILQKLNEYGSDRAGKQKVADDLGISVRSLYRKIQTYAI
ncbi:sigma-54 interaction domain-containing protein [Lysinibacillus sp. NPDC094177]|uniref:sigma-54 interaction domain-containing protein n=1 Tax=Lysinibacillus sp. NPDC094177 TaxID=3390580 RepID=UPI003D04E3C9